MFVTLGDLPCLVRREVWQRPARRTSHTAPHFPATRAFAIFVAMTKLEHIQASIEALEASEIARLRAWLDELDARLFDEKIERDAKAGKLDALANAARANLKAGLCRKL
jgi:hypothetical protein